MKREIKFRGRKNSTKEWIYGSLLTDDDGGYAIIQIRHNPISNGVVSGWCFGIEKGTECQYTGLKDKNGREIYEGDHFGNPIMYVSFNDGCFTLGGVPLKGYINGEYMEQIQEVKGNIYETNH